MASTLPFGSGFHLEVDSCKLGSESMTTFLSTPVSQLHHSIDVKRKSCSPLHLNTQTCPLFQQFGSLVCIVLNQVSKVQFKAGERLPLSCMAYTILRHFGRRQYSLSSSSGILESLRWRLRRDLKRLDALELMSDQEKMG